MPWIVRALIVVPHCGNDEDKIDDQKDQIVSFASMSWWLPRGGYHRPVNLNVLQGSP